MRRDDACSIHGVKRMRGLWRKSKPSTNCSDSLDSSSGGIRTEICGDRSLGLADHAFSLILPLPLRKVSTGYLHFHHPRAILLPFTFLHHPSASFLCIHSIPRTSFFFTPRFHLHFLVLPLMPRPGSLFMVLVGMPLITLVGPIMVSVQQTFSIC